MASPIFNPTRPPSSLESLAQEEIRALCETHRRGDLLVVTANTHPGIFEHALSKLLAGEDLKFRAPRAARIIPKVYLAACSNEAFSIKGLSLKEAFLDSPDSLEERLFETIAEAFLAIGFEVVKGLPDRYHREWVI